MPLESVGLPRGISFYVTKSYFNLLFVLLCEILLSLLDSGGDQVAVTPAVVHATNVHPMLMNP